MHYIWCEELHVGCLFHNYFQKKSSFSWNVFAFLLLSDDVKVNFDFDFVLCELFASPCILLARLIRFSKESACRVYMANPADETTMPAIMNMAIVLSLSSSVVFVPITTAPLVDVPGSAPVAIIDIVYSPSRLSRHRQNDSDSSNLVKIQG